jgi:hypothetical protein
LLALHSDQGGFVLTTIPFSRTCRSTYVWLSLLLALPGCKEIEAALKEDRPDITGSYELITLSQDGDAGCTVSSSGCRIRGVIVDTKVTSADLFIRDAPSYSLSASALESSVARNYNYDGSYVLDTSINVVFHAGNFVFNGRFKEPNTMTVTVPAKLFNADASASSVVVLIFRR